MPIEFRCTTCQRLLRTKDDTAGKQAKCPECGTILTVPDYSTALPDAAAVSESPPLQGHSAAAKTAAIDYQVAANPYQSPLTPGLETAELASLGARFLGALVDGALYFLVGAAALALGMVDRMGAGVLREPKMQGMIVVTTLPLAILQWYLIATSGQSIGKKVVGTRIVDYTSGGKSDFLHCVVLRSWLPGLLGSIPCVGILFPLVDILFIFGAERRCVHDYLAGTKVIDANRTQASESSRLGGIDRPVS